MRGIEKHLRVNHAFICLMNQRFQCHCLLKFAPGQIRHTCRRIVGLRDTRKVFMRRPGTQSALEVKCSKVPCVETVIFILGSATTPKRLGGRFERFVKTFV